MTPEAKARFQTMLKNSQAVPDETPLNAYAEATFGDLRAALASLDRFEDQFRGLLQQCEASSSATAPSGS